MLAEKPRYEVASFSLPRSGALEYNNLIFSGFDLPYQVYGGLSIAFRDIRYLTFAVTAQGQSYTAMDLTTFNRIRTAVEYHLLSLKQQTRGTETTELDCQLEICRLAALIYVQLALHLFLPAYAVMRSLKRQIISSLKEKEKHRIGEGMASRPSLLLWALFMGGILSLDEREEKWFAQRITQQIRTTGITTWAQMQSWLREVCWLDRLHTSTCKSLWQRVEDAIAERQRTEACSY